MHISWRPFQLVWLASEAFRISWYIWQIFLINFKFSLFEFFLLIWIFLYVTAVCIIVPCLIILFFHQFHKFCAHKVNQNAPNCKNKHIQETGEHVRLPKLGKKRNKLLKTNFYQGSSIIRKNKNKADSIETGRIVITYLLP